MTIGKKHPVHLCSQAIESTIIVEQFIITLQSTSRSGVKSFSFSTPIFFFLLLFPFRKTVKRMRLYVSTSFWWKNLFTTDHLLPEKNRISEITKQKKGNILVEHLRAPCEVLSVIARRYVYCVQVNKIYNSVWDHVTSSALIPIEAIAILTTISEWIFISTLMNNWALWCGESVHCQ